MGNRNGFWTSFWLWAIWLQLTLSGFWLIRIGNELSKIVEKL